MTMTQASDENAPVSAYEQHVRKWMSDRREKRCVTAAAAGAELELAMLDIIGVDWWTGEGITSKWVKQQLDANPTVSVIRVLLDSPGGSVFDGVAIHNLLKRCKARVEIEVIGEASSAASVVAMAGDVIKMHEGTTMMIHRASSCGCGFAEDFRTVADALDTITGSITDIYETRSGRARADIEAMVKKETWMSAADAVKEGFADEVVKAGSKPVPAAKGRAKNFGDIEIDLSDLSAVPGVVPIEVAGTAYDVAVSQASAPVASSIGAAIPTQQTTAPTGAPTTTNAPAAPTEEPTMSQSQIDTMTTIRALLGLGAGTPETDVIAAVTRLRELERSAVSATSAKSTEEAIGGLSALKAKADQLETQKVELDKIRADRDRQNFETLLAQGQRIPAKLTPATSKDWMGYFDAAVAEGKGEREVERLRGWLKNAPVVIAQGPTQPRAGSGSSNGEAPALVVDGKSYEQLSYSQKANLKTEQPELYGLMRSDWESRGKPATKAA